jgi:hypothetical protein
VITPEHIYQGSSGVNTVTVIAAFNSTAALEIGFRMPSGIETGYKPMIYSQSLENGLASAWTYTLPYSVTSEAGIVRTSINVVSSGNRTSYLVNIPIEESNLPEPPETPDEDTYALLLQYYAQLSAFAANVFLVDFTVDTETGVGTKHYSDGTTATVQLPTGGGSGGEAAPYPGLTILSFTAENWDDGELAFTPTQTGQSSNAYMAQVERVSGESYEVAANKIFKGSDGSLLMSDVTTPFAGRIVISGQVSADLATVLEAIDAELVDILGV